MMDEKTYKKEIVRMWDSIRDDEYKGKGSCDGVYCGDCPLSTQDDFVNDTCTNNINAFKVIKIVEKWSKEHPKPKYKVSQLEYNILLTAIDFSAEDETFNDIDILYGLLKKGYFNGSTTSMSIREYLKNCEVTENVR